MNWTCDRRQKGSEVKTDVLIIGGGLAGLALADALQRAGTDFLLLEARDRFGGRIKAEVVGEGYYDMGPAWFWPGQPRIAHLINRLGLRRFDQHYEGILSFEDESGRVERGRGYASMQGSWRLDGGLQQLITGLAAMLPEHRKRLNTQVMRLEHSANGVTAMLNDGTEVYAHRIALAIPPRLAAQSIEFAPALQTEAMQAMSATPTWMAGQAKALAVYEKPFWRAEGLSGDAMSHHGPMVEIHDASPASSPGGALFGFIGVPPDQRQNKEALRAHILAQLVRLFGPAAAEPTELLVKDWAFDPHTATQQDRQPLFSHPRYGLPSSLQNLWDGQIVFAGTEVASQFGGYLEGALEAAEAAASTLNSDHFQLVDSARR